MIKMGRDGKHTRREKENGCDQKHPMWTNRLTTLFTTLVSTTLASVATTSTTLISTTLSSVYTLVRARESTVRVLTTTLATSVTTLSTTTVATATSSVTRVVAGSTVTTTSGLGVGHVDLLVSGVQSALQM